MKDSLISYASISIAIIAISISVITINVIQQQGEQVILLTDKITQLESESLQNSIVGRGDVSQQSISKMMLSDLTINQENGKFEYRAIDDIEERLSGLEYNVTKLHSSLKPILSASDQN